MSLDVSLYYNEGVSYCKHCNNYHPEINEVYEANITHNLRRMAIEARIYHHVWRPEEIGITMAKELIIPLKQAIRDMKARPGYYKRYNSPNGWGLYKNFLPWLKNYWKACVKYPEALIRISR